MSRARNAGAAAARQDILAFVDDDMLVSSDWFGCLVRTLLDAGPRAAVTGCILSTPPEIPGGFTPSARVDDVRRVFEGRVQADPLASGNMAVYRTAFTDIGPFDERLGPGSAFPAAEDNDFGFRLLEAGYRIVYAPEARLYHRAWRSPGDYTPLRWNYGRGQGAFYAKHLRLRDHHILRRFAASAKDHLFRIPRHLRRRRYQLARGEVAWILGFLSGAAHWLLKHGRHRAAP